jgi:hypothetical protein
VERPGADYGVDVRVDIFENDEVTGLELLVQLKASNSPSESEDETIKLGTATYSYLWDKVQVVLLVKYVEADNEAYWLLLGDVPEPNQRHKTFTVRIPKANRLSTIDWQQIQNYVRDVTNGKAWNPTSKALQGRRTALMLYSGARTNKVCTIIRPRTPPMHTEATTVYVIPFLTFELR